MGKAPLSDVAKEIINDPKKAKDLRRAIKNARNDTVEGNNDEVSLNGSVYKVVLISELKKRRNNHQKK